MTTRVLPSLTPSALESLAKAVAEERLKPPFTKAAVAQLVPASVAEEAAGTMAVSIQVGMAPMHLAYLLNAVAEERRAVQKATDRLELVWTGPEQATSQLRDTAVVVRGLFQEAKTSVILASYAVDEGEKAHELFRPLAENMDGNPALEVKLFLNIQRPFGSQTPEPDLVRDFAKRFRTDVWPGTRLPEVYYDPRALEASQGPRACLHAKCLVVDDRKVLLTSANFTEAAQVRNIEAGVVVEDAALARQMRGQFEELVEAGGLRPLPVTA